MSRRAITSTLLASVISLMLIQPAHADNSYLDSDPTPKSQATLQPSRVTVAFHDSIPRSPSTIVIRDAAGNDVSNGAFQVEANNIYVNLAYPFPKGTYTVYYRVADKDGTPFGGEYQFSYGPGDFKADGTKTWRGKSNIPKVVSLPGDAGSTSGPSPATPSASPSTTDASSAPSDSTLDKSNDGSILTDSDHLPWIAGAIIAMLLIAAAFVIRRRRRA